MRDRGLCPTAPNATVAASVLKGYDYAQAGAYFVTIVAQDRACLFGDLTDGDMRLNDAGRMMQTAWDELPVFYLEVDTAGFVVMPNHIHGIIVLVGAAPCGRPDGRSCDIRPDHGQAQGPAPTNAKALSLSDVVHRFKTMTTKRYTDGVRRSGWPPFRERLCQRNYHEHVIRDEASLCRIQQYILDNPARWVLDRENPQVVSAEPEYPRLA